MLPGVFVCGSALFCVVTICVSRRRVSCMRWSSLILNRLRFICKRPKRQTRNASHPPKCALAPLLSRQAVSFHSQTSSQLVLTVRWVKALLTVKVTTDLNALIYCQYHCSCQSIAFSAIIESWGFTSVHQRLCRLSISYFCSDELLREAPALLSALRSFVHAGMVPQPVMPSFVQAQAMSSMNIPG